MCLLKSLVFKICFVLLLFDNVEATINCLGLCVMNSVINEIFLIECCDLLDLWC